MKNHIVFKCLAMVLCACCLLVSVASGAAIAALVSVGLYDNSVEQLQQRRMQEVLEGVAQQTAARYAAANHSNCPAALIDHYYGEGYLFQLSDPNLWYYTLEDSNGKILATNYVSQDNSQATPVEFAVCPTYPFILEYNSEGTSILDVLTPAEDATLPQETTPGENAPDATQTEERDYLYKESYSWDDDSGETHDYILGFRSDDSLVYLVTVYVLPGAYAQDSSYEWDLLQLAYGYRYTLFLPLLLGLAMFGVLLVYLCCVAGHAPGSKEVRPGGLNILPLDLYTLLLAGVAAIVVGRAVEFAQWCFPGSFNWGAIWLEAVLCGIVALIFVAFFFALAVQMKMGLAYICRQSLTGILLERAWRGWKWLWKKLVCAIAATGRWIASVYEQLPTIWQWLLTGGILLVLVLAAGLSRNITAIVSAALAFCAVAVYVTRSFGKLLKSAQEMSRGNLNRSVDERALVGSFKAFAQHLNALADVAVVAAKKQMRSERMKAELVTNVSHDIKTPLTSIINYVDLLQNTKSEAEAREYLEVLDRQSQRLKKLIDDLMEMSKASTGNMTVDILETDAVETVTQALGEFSDKLDMAQLTPVFHPPQEPMRILADGRLTWRVLSNLLSNAVKYAMPNTRLYIDIVKAEGNVLISVKNVSAEPLNVSSEELMERFVRGDTSRHTEGSGLGLNIAKSLMELQHGQMHLLIDGDLFKATLVFPSA